MNVREFANKMVKALVKGLNKRSKKHEDEIVSALVKGLNKEKEHGKKH